MSMKAEVKPRVFLDTSVQITRVLGTVAKRQRIDHVLANEIVACTTAYVYMEYQRTLVADFAHVHRVLQQQGNWGDAIAEVASGARLFRPRALVRVNRILGETLNRSHLDVEKGLLLLSTYLEYRLQTLFWQYVTPVDDTIGCDLLTTGVLQQPDESYQVAATCRKETAACQLPAFLYEQRAKLQAITAYLAVHPNVIKDQLRVEQLLRSVQQEPRNALGQTSCWSLGDVIILLHVPSDCMVWSLDPDFAPLATALGLHLYSPTL
jgi:hypothetical protein